VILDRRGRSLFIGREVRGLPRVEIEPGAAAYWDNRFHIANNGDGAALIAAGDFQAHPLVGPPLIDSLPKGVFRRATMSVPRLISGDSKAMSVRIVIPQCEHFLPSSRVELANSLASVAGLEHFPSLSLG
jgi:hypothetical protein